MLRMGTHELKYEIAPSLKKDKNNSSVMPWWFIFVKKMATSKSIVGLTVGILHRRAMKKMYRIYGFSIILFLSSLLIITILNFPVKGSYVRCRCILLVTTSLHVKKLPLNNMVPRSYHVFHRIKIFPFVFNNRRGWAKALQVDLVDRK